MNCDGQDGKYKASHARRSNGANIYTAREAKSRKAHLVIAGQFIWRQIEQTYLRLGSSEQQTHSRHFSTARCSHPAIQAKTSRGAAEDAKSLSISLLSSQIRPETRDAPTFMPSALVSHNSQLSASFYFVSSCTPFGRARRCVRIDIIEFGRCVSFSETLSRRRVSAPAWRLPARPHKKTRTWTERNKIETERATNSEKDAKRSRR